MKKNDFSNFFNIYNILSIILTIGIFVIYRLSQTNNDFAMQIFFINKDFLQRIFMEKTLVAFSVFLVFLAFIEYFNIKYLKNKKLRNSFLSNLFIKLVAIYLMLFFKVRTLIYNFFILYIIAMNLIYFFEFLNEVKEQKGIK